MSVEDDWKHRIEKKIDDMSDALRALVRIDERMTSHSDGLARIGKRVDDHESRIRQVEIASAGSQQKLSGTERIVWLFATSAAAVLVYLLR